jgi:hypothetical protein
MRFGVHCKFEEYREYYHRLDKITVELIYGDMLLIKEDTVNRFQYVLDFDGTIANDFGEGKLLINTGSIFLLPPFVHNGIVSKQFVIFSSGALLGFGYKYKRYGKFESIHKKIKDFKVETIRRKIKNMWYPGGRNRYKLVRPKYLTVLNE